MTNRKVKLHGPALHAGVDTAIIVVSVAAINVVQQLVHQENQQLVPLP